ncbi:TSC22 domain family protein 2 isoform X2 [Salarias fasciatus]|uniref:TSC22 domain family protein 2 isoform X2 n=1 Tax=Salarias fasciatus TaxID=181472 RepID=UPI0011768C02|nr:TSC22 domain family protein 2 isoform X2 [Salarias fasciatus]
MSKMPAKKKSCFQITSVTQAQVAVIGTADDTESLDDPDESRTEDVSSEIYDMSRAEYEPACDRSSSEEALNNVGDPEVVSAMAPANAPLAGQLSGLSSNPVGDFRKVGVSGSAQQPTGSGVTPGLPLIPQPGAMQQQSTPAAGVSVNASRPATVTSAAPPPATSTVSSTSRFRVIKLDHGTGESFRRGRWTCTEFYEKDSEGSAVSRTVDSIRHAGGMLDAAGERDSGIGLTGGSVAAPSALSGQGLGSTVDPSVSSTRMHSVETPPQQQQIHHQNYSARQQGQQPQVPGSHHLTSQSSGLKQNQTEYYQQQQSTSMPPGHAAGQALPVSSLPAVPQPVGQGPTSIMPLPSGGASMPSQIGDVALGVGASGSKPAPSILQQQAAGMGGAGGSMLVGGSALQQPTASPYATTGQPQPHGHPTSSGVQNVPAFTVSSSVPATVPTAVPSASSAAMPNVTTSSLPQGQIPHSKPPVALGMQGLPVAGFGLMEGVGGRKSEGLISAQSSVASGKEPVKPLMPESLQLTTPTVNSLFGIHIPVDGEDDSASGTNVVAIDNKIEQAMDLVKSHLMYAVREEVEVLKEQIKELLEKNSVLEKENAVLKSLANSEQLSQLSTQSGGSSGATPPQQQGLSQQQQPPPPQPHPQLQLHPKPPQPQTQPQLDPGQQQQPQPNVTSA